MLDSRWQVAGALLPRREEMSLPKQENTSFPTSLLVLVVALAVSSAPAIGGELYVGVSAAADRLSVGYQKIVDNTNPQNFSLNQGQTFRDAASGAGFGHSYGFLGGYRMPLSVTGIYVAVEGEMLRHGGAASGRLAGVGTSDGRNQLGEVWPENWSVGQDRSYGVTARLGAGIPFFGTWFGPSIYALVGLRRLNATFKSGFAGCFEATPCTSPNQLVSGSEDFSENSRGLVFGGGLEKRFGSLALRGEVRVTDFSEAERITRFEDVFVTVPITLQPDSISLGASLVWYF